MPSTVNQVKKYWGELPLLLRKFFIKALLLLLIWELCFQLYLKPHRTIDLPLTALTTATTVGVLSFFYEKQALSWEEKDHGTDIRLNGHRSIGIGDNCNGLELFVLYAGFIICIPTSFKRAALFIVLGIIGIFILNILRCCGMFWFGLHQKEWFDFAHHYAFKIIVYAAIFGGWVWYCRKINYHE